MGGGVYEMHMRELSSFLSSPGFFSVFIYTRQRCNKSESSWIMRVFFLTCIKYTQKKNKIKKLNRYKTTINCNTISVHFYLAIYPFCVRFFFYYFISFKCWLLFLFTSFGQYTEWHVIEGQRSFKIKST